MSACGTYRSFYYGLYTLLGNDADDQDFVYMYDTNGILRGEIPIIGYRSHRMLIQNQMLYMSVSTHRMAAINHLGMIEHIYNLGNYMGNNYQSAIITAQNALKEYPYTRYKETLSMLILKSKYQEAVQSIEEKKPERFRDVIDEYYSFINDYPSGEYSKEAENIFKVANKYVKD